MSEHLLVAIKTDTTTLLFFFKKTVETTSLSENNHLQRIIHLGIQTSNFAFNNYCNRFHGRKRDGLKAVAVVGTVIVSVLS